MGTTEAFKPCVIVWASKASTLPDILGAVFRLGCYRGADEGADQTPEERANRVMRGFDIPTNSPAVIETIRARLSDLASSGGYGCEDVATQGLVVAAALDSVPTDGWLYGQWEESEPCPPIPIGAL